MLAARQTPTTLKSRLSTLRAAFVGTPLVDWLLGYTVAVLARKDIHNDYKTVVQLPPQI